MTNPKKEAKITPCIVNQAKELRENIEFTKTEIGEVEKKLKKRFGEEFDYEYSDYGYLDDRYLIFHINEKRHKMGGSWDIEGQWDSLKDEITQCLGKPITKLQWEKIEKDLADLVGDLAELNNEKQMLDAVEDLADDEIPNYESEY